MPAEMSKKLPMLFAGTNLPSDMNSKCCEDIPFMNGDLAREHRQRSPYRVFVAGGTRIHAAIWFTEAGQAGRSCLNRSVPA